MDINNAKSYFWILIDLLVIAVIVNLVFFVMPAVKHYGDSLYPVRTMSVSAEGKTTVTPDIATVSFSVVSQGKNPQDLADTNNQKVTAVINNIKSHDVEAKDITTTGYNLAPDYQYDENTRRSYITGYTLTQTVTVKIRDIKKTAEILGGATPLGVNQIGGISFSVDNPETYLAKARSEAFTKAQQKAETMAAANGVSLGNVMNVSEYQGGYPMPYAYGMGAGATKAAADVASIAPPTIEPGTQEVTINVSLTYALQ